MDIFYQPIKNPEKGTFFVSDYVQCERGRTFQFFQDKRPGLLLYILIKNWLLSVIADGHLCFPSAYVLMVHLPTKATGRLSLT